MKLNKVLISSCLMAVFSLSANATLVEFAAYTDVYGTTNGGDNINNAFSELNANNKAMVSFSNTDYLPSLKVKAKSNGTEGRQAKASALQKYTYNGNIAKDIILTYNLHGTKITSASQYPSFLRADIGVILGNQVSYNSGTSFGTNFFEGGALTGNNQNVGYNAIFLPEGSNKNMFGQLIFNIQPGESFFLYSEVVARAYNGYIDAWNTLSMNFADNTGLTAASYTPPQSSIPEPSSIILFLSALALFTSRKIKNS